MRLDPNESLRARYKVLEGECKRLERDRQNLQKAIHRAAYIINTQGRELAILGTTLEMISDMANWSDREEGPPIWSGPKNPWTVAKEAVDQAREIAERARKGMASQPVQSKPGGNGRIIRP